MIDIIIIASLAFTSIQIIVGVVKESKIFVEFGQSRSLALLALFLPFGPIALLALPIRFGWIPATIVAALCYFPTLILSKKQHNIFECSGLDKTNRAQNVAGKAFWVSVFGLLYVSFISAISGLVIEFGND